MSIGTSPYLKILVGCHESGATATRANAGVLGTAHDFYPETDTAKPGEGVPTISDGQGARAAVIAQDPTSHSTFTDEWRRLISKLETGLPSAHSAYVALPIASAAEDFAWGCRFKMVAPYSEGISDEDLNILLGFGPTAGAVPHLALCFKWQDDTDESLGARLWIMDPDTGAAGMEVTDQGGVPDFTTTSGSPPSWYLTADTWFRLTVRTYYDGSTGYIHKVYLLDESTGILYTFTQTSAAGTTNYAASSVERAWQIGWAFDGSGGSSFTTAYAAICDVFVYDGALSDTDATNTTRDGITIPWTQPDYYREAHELYSAVTKENADYPKTRPLPAGATICRHPVDVLCQEVRARLEGWKAGQPWAVRHLDFVFDPAGPFGSQRARRGERPDLASGVWRTPGKRPWGACEDSNDVEFTAQGPRRRRGFKIRRDVDSGESTSAFNAFFTFRDYNDELFWLYKVGTKLYADAGGAATQIDTGWLSTQTPCAFTLDGRLVVLSAGKQAIWDGGATIARLGAAAPGTIGVAVGAGGTLLGAYYYAATWYDPTSGDETAPIVSALVSPSTQKVTVTLPASTAAPETRFTQFRLYRTNNGGTAPNLFYSTAITATAGSTTYDDLGDADGTVLVGQVTDSSGVLLAYLTGAAPDSFAIGISHKERAIYAKGATNPERIYISEPNEPARFYYDSTSDTGQWIAADGPVRALASWQGRVLIFTDNTVEIVESDFVRDADGNLNISRNVVSRSVGAFGQNAVIVYQGRIFWMDRRGVFTMQGTDAVPLTERIADLFPYINTNLGANVVGGWNHLTRTLWWTLPSANRQTDSSLMQTQFVTPVDEPGKWFFHGLDATFVGQFDDDLNGQRFGLIDHGGIFKELESYEGDGQEGDESGTFDDDGTDDYAGTPAGIATITLNVITVEGTPGWTTDTHRGKSVVLRDRSTGLLYYHTIRGNGSASLTLDRDVVSAIAAGDGYYIGAQNAYAAFAGHDFGSANRKVVRQIQYTFADLTREDLYL